MKVDYDTEADALSIDLVEVDRADYGEEVEGTTCVVAVRDGVPVNVALLGPAKHLDDLKLAAQRFDLDPEALLVAARAGLAAPDRAITVDVSCN